MKIKMLGMALLLAVASPAMAAKFTIIDSLGKSTPEVRYNLLVTLKNGYNKQSSLFKGTRLVNDAATMAIDLKVEELGSDGAVLKSESVITIGDEETEPEGYIKIVNAQEVDLSLSGTTVRTKAAMTLDSKGEVKTLRVDSRNLGKIVMAYSGLANKFLGDAKMRIVADVSDFVCQRGDSGLKCQVSVKVLASVGR